MMIVRYRPPYVDIFGFVEWPNGEFMHGGKTYKMVSVRSDDPNFDTAAVAAMHPVAALSYLSKQAVPLPVGLINRLFDSPEGPLYTGLIIDYKSM